MGYKKFILKFYSLEDIYLKKVNLILFTSLLWTFCKVFIKCKKAYDNLPYSIRTKVMYISYLPYLIMTTICYFPLIIVINIVGMSLTLANTCSFSSFFNILENLY